MHYQDREQTLPSVIPAIAEGPAREELLLTVVFHPDLNRIGQVARVQRKQGTAAWVLGRRSPEFSGRGLDAAPLADPHISRRALELDYTGRQLHLRRFEGSSRCRVGDEELFSSTSFDVDTLRAGVPLVLSHSVVLMMRLVERGASDSDPEQPAPPEAVGGILGDSAAMVALRREIEDVAASDYDVLVRGETGSGKELVARAIHAASARAAGPLISVNMAAIPEELASAALFGNARGAFTGAERANPGYFRQARGGSLFLDEIGDTPASVQPQLLRVLQQREVQSVGGPIEQVDVRVISATDADLESPDRGFKTALRHRLAACEITVPALRDHPEDIGELLAHFLVESAAELGRRALLPTPALTASSIAIWANIFYLCSRYDWPGNVRELANLARQVLVDSREVPVLGREQLARLTGGRRAKSAHEATALKSRRSMQSVADEEFAAAMDACRFEIQAVARQLGVSRTAVYRHIEQSSHYRLATAVSARELADQLAAAGGDLERVSEELRVSLVSLRRRARDCGIALS